MAESFLKNAPAPMLGNELFAVENKTTSMLNENTLINHENSYQMIIKEKSDIVCKLEKQLADLILSPNLQTK